MRGWSAFVFLCALHLAISFQVFIDFDDGQKVFDANWKVTKNEKYSGSFLVEEAKEAPVDGDLGLVLGTPGAYHAAYLDFPFVVDPADHKVIVIQYEVRFQERIHCGGSYLKFISALEPMTKVFDNTTPYSILFGPDNCGDHNKIQFIGRHRNPVTNQMVEHPAKNCGISYRDLLTHLYGIYIYSNRTYAFHFDGQEIVRGSMYTEFDPPFYPPKMIDDPTDLKPLDWVDEISIRDPNAFKPEDWDETIPETIPDPDAIKPDDWLDDEPEFIPDPNAYKPVEWDDELDGDWEHPLVYNKACEYVSGCGPWLPTKPNPEYKGIWVAPLISNPLYKGPWTPRQIPNPDYYEDDQHPFPPIRGLGIEVLTMQGGMMIDNILFTNDTNTARNIAVMSDIKKKHQTEFYEAKELAQKEWDERVARYGRFVQKYAPYIAVVLGTLLGIFVGVIFCTSPPSPKKTAATETKPDQNQQDESETKKTQ